MELIIPNSISHQTTSYDTTSDGEMRIPRPPNAFMLFGKDYRKVLATKFQNLSNKQISKLLGNEWKNMNLEDKTKYQQMAQEAHQQHLQKYPGYYYSPLEARQRKAERKRKTRMSRTYQRTKEETVNESPMIAPFGGHRFPFHSPIHPLIRPVFGTPIPPRVRFGQPYFRPPQPFGGFAHFTNFVYPPTPRPQLIVSVNNDHNYAAQQSTDQLSEHYIDINEDEVSLESQPQQQQEFVSNEIYQQFEDQLQDVSQTTNLEMLSNFLPPMHNPNIEVTSVDINGLRHDILSNEEVTKMMNASVDHYVNQYIKEEPIDMTTIDD